MANLRRKIDFQNTNRMLIQSSHLSAVWWVCIRTALGVPLHLVDASEKRQFITLSAKRLQVCCRSRNCTTCSTSQHWVNQISVANFDTNLVGTLVIKPASSTTDRSSASRGQSTLSFDSCTSKSRPGCRDKTFGGSAVDSLWLTLTSQAARVTTGMINIKAGSSIRDRFVTCVRHSNFRRLIHRKNKTKSVEAWTVGLRRREKKLDSDSIGIVFKEWSWETNDLFLICNDRQDTKCTKNFPESRP